MTPQPSPRRPALVSRSSSLDAALRRDVPLVTATERQAREIRYYLRDSDVETRASCFSQSEFWASLFRSGQDDGQIDQALLSPEALRVMARDAASRPAWREHLDSFLDAWQLAHGAGLSFGDDMFGANEATRTFATWARNLEENLGAKGFVSAVQLPELVHESMHDLPDFSSFGFRNSQAAFRAFLAKSASYRVDLEPRRVADCRFSAFTDRDDELRSAAEWARSMLHEYGTIAVVVDELGSTTGQVIQRFDAVFADVDLERYVSFSGGVSLAQERVVSHALGALKMMIEGVEDDFRRSLCLSPFLFPETDLRSLALRQLPFVPLAAASPAGLEYLADRPHRNDIAGLVRKCLAQWGWPGRGLDSREYQAVAQFERLIDGVAKASRLAARISWPDVLMMLNEQSKRAVFSPQAQHAPIQVLGRDESFGLIFDAVWVTGCQRGNWPRAPRKNPFLPTDVYMRGLIPGGTFEAVHAGARELQSWWESNASILVQSMVVEDEASVASSRAPLLPAHSVLDEDRLSVSGHPAERASRPVHLPFDDEPPAAIETHRASVAGGTTLLTDQSLCAFRGWAIHRLDLHSRTPNSVLPTRAELGSVLHELLAHATIALPSRAAIESAPDEYLDRIVNTLIERQSWPPEFRRIEEDRLNRLVRAWRDVELKRPDFDVIAIEEEREIDIGPIRLRARVDRIDRSGEQTLVIDYKSGRSSINDWLPPRPSAPQVPLYVLNEEADAAAYLQLDDGVRLIGVGDLQGEVRGLRTSARLGFASMGELTSAWRDAIEHLADEVVAGINTPMPSAKSCGSCHLAPLCREFSRG